jgi:predicted NBD/HSP70 family sugar kinase
MTRVLAVDVGATKFAAAVVDGEGTIHTRVERPIAGADPTAVLHDVTTRALGAAAGGPGRCLLNK